MPTQEAKAHHVGEWASLRNTSPEIAEAIFEVAGYDEKMAEKIWEEGSDEVLVKAFAKEGANKQVISSQADSLIKISRSWADFFPANTSNQPV